MYLNGIPDGIVAVVVVVVVVLNFENLQVDLEES